MSNEPYRLFISYAHSDKEHLLRLMIHLAVPLSDEQLVVWSDREIVGGGDWDNDIREEISTCDAVVFLVSADLLASRYVNGVEARVAQERLAKGEIDVLPVPIHSCLLDRTWLAKRQALWDPANPIGAINDPGAREVAWDSVVRELLRAVDATTESRQTPTATAPGRRGMDRVARFRRSASAPLLGRGGFFGRDDELANLDAWLDDGESYGAARVVVLRALGGMGKSALAWHWSQTNVPRRGPLAGYEGVFWWSFYTRGSDIRAFAQAALTFMGVAGDDLPDGLGPRLELLAGLSQDHGAVFILDGFERELRRYARRDAPDDETAAARQSGAARPDDCLDPETDRFLACVATIPGASRWLMTTRVTPATLNDLTGVREVELGGLSRQATRALFKEQEIEVSNAALDDAERRFGGHGLTLSIAARTLKRKGVRDLDQVAQEHGGFSAFWATQIGRIPAVAALEEEAAHRLRVLDEAIDALSNPARDVLQSFTFVEQSPSVAMLELLNSHLPASAIPKALEELRAHGLLARPEDTFVYELHPVVREAADRRTSGKGLERAIDAFEELDTGRVYKNLASAQPAIDLFLALARAERLDAAYHIYRSRLQDLFIAEGASSRWSELVGRLCTTDGAPLLKDVDDQISLLDELYSALQAAGRQADAARTTRHLAPLIDEARDATSQVIARANLVAASISAGRLADAVRYADDRSQGLADPAWRLYYDVLKATLAALLGNADAGITDERSLIGRAADLGTPRQETIAAIHIASLAWRTRDPALMGDVDATVSKCAPMTRAPWLIAISELQKLRRSSLHAAKHSATEIAALVDAARELQARFAALDVGRWVDLVGVVVAMFEARLGREEARRAASDLDGIATGFERSGDVISTIETLLDAAEAWHLAGDRDAARADAMRARQLAYCDGPPHTAKLLEDRTDAVLARL